MSTWPASLPPIRLPVSSQRQDGTIRTQMDTGPDKVRRRFSATSNFFTFPLRLTGAEFSTLDTFFNDTLSGGSESFDMADPHSGTTESFRFQSPPEYQVIVGEADTDKRILDVTINLERLP